MNIWNEIKGLLVAGGLLCLGFTLGVLFSFWVYPDDVEGASKAIMIFVGAGSMAGIFLIVHRVRQILKI